MNDSTPRRARMRNGHRPVILGGIAFAPEHPTYWTVSQDDAAAIEGLVAAGQCEYEPVIAARAPGGRFAVAGTEIALETVRVAPPPAGNANKFARRPPKGH